jgi:hypothetical protein
MMIVAAKPKDDSRADRCINTKRRRPPMKMVERKKFRSTDELLAPFEHKKPDAPFEMKMDHAGILQLKVNPTEYIPTLKSLLLHANAFLIGDLKRLVHHLLGILRERFFVES